MKVSISALAMTLALFAPDAFAGVNGCVSEKNAYVKSCTAPTRMCFQGTSGPCPAGQVPLARCLMPATDQAGAFSANNQRCAVRAPNRSAPTFIYDTAELAMGGASRSGQLAGESPGNAGNAAGRGMANAESAPAADGSGDFSFKPEPGPIAGVNQLGGTPFGVGSDGRTYQCSSFEGGSCAEPYSVLKNGRPITPEQAQTLGTTRGDFANGRANTRSPAGGQGAAGIGGAPAQQPGGAGARGRERGDEGGGDSAAYAESGANAPNEITELREAERDAKRAEGYRSSGGGGADAAGGGADPCSTSSAINAAKYGCSGTYTLVETAKVTNTVAQAVGAGATQITGQLAQQQALKEGTQSSALRVAGETQVTAGKIGLTTGVVNAALGAYQLTQAAGHSSNANKLRGALHGDAGGLAITENAKDKTFQTRATNIRQGQDGYAEVEKFKSEDSRRAFSEFKLNERGQYSAVTVTEQVLQEKRQAVKTAAQYGANSRQLLDAQNVLRQAEATQKAELKARAEGRDIRKQDLATQMRLIGSKAENEQAQAAQAANAGGMGSLVQGISQLVQGGFNIAGGNALKDAAKALKSAENTALNGQLPQFDNLDTNDASAPRNSTVISGNGEDPNGANVGVGQTDDDLLGPLGPGFNPNGGGGGRGPGAPAPGGFTKGGGGGAPGGGGAGPGGGGGASTQAATEPQGDQSAKYADIARNQGTYEVGGAAFTSGGGGGAGATAGPDLSALAKMLAQGEKDAELKNGILDFGGGERGLASEQPFSPLDRSANLFERAHAIQQEKQRRGLLGGLAR